VELLLEGGRKVGGHLADAVAGGVADARVGVLEEADDAVDHLVQVALHLLVGALGRRREGHEEDVGTFLQEEKYRGDLKFLSITLVI